MPIPLIAGLVATFGAIGGAILSLVQAVGQHPVLAYFLILLFLLLDGGISYGYNIQGLFGTIFSYVFSELGVPIEIYSWQLLILFGIFPIFAYCVRASVQS